MLSSKIWIPASAGMTNVDVSMHFSTALLVSASCRLCCVNIFYMQPAKTIQAARRHPVLRAALGLIAGALLFLAVIQSLTVTVAWWRNELPAMHAADWFWILLLPVLIGIYFRFFSIFRPDCHTCLPEDRDTPSGPRGP